MHEIGGHHVVQYFGYSFNWDTIWTTWLTMAIVILFFWLGTRKLTFFPTSKWQNFLEFITCFLIEQMDSSLGPGGRRVVPVIVTLFVFIMFANWLGLCPAMTSPTNDLNCTLALSLTTMLIIHVTGVMVKGTHYIKHFFEPSFPFVIIHLIDETAKPITMAFRLFGNILAGEVLIIILLQLAPVWFPIPSVIWLAFSIIVGVIQAFIFCMLSICFFSGAVKEDH